MTDDLTEHDWRGVQRLLFAVEDQLAKADDVNATLEQMTTRAATMIPAGADRESSNTISASWSGRLSRWSWNDEGRANHEAISYQQIPRLPSRSTCVTTKNKNPWEETNER